MKNAFILSTSSSFFTGTVAFLDALEFYGHTEDVHLLLEWDIYNPKKGGDWRMDLLKQFQLNSPFKIFLQPIEDLAKAYPITKLRKVDAKVEIGWRCRFYAYPYMLEHDYETYFIWQGDLLLLNNVSQYFEIAKKFSILSNNFHQYKHYVWWRDKKPIDHGMANPICNIPFITSDRELLTEVWEQGCDYGRGDMARIWNSIVSLDKYDTIYQVPFNNWVYDWHSPQSRIFHPEYPDSGLYFRCDGSRFNAYHGPMWSAGWAFKEKYGPQVIAKHKIFHGIYQRVAAKYNFTLGK